MPISQDRMMTLLEEAERMKKWGTDLREGLARAVRLAKSAEELQADVILLLERNPPPQSEVIAVERHHWERQAKGNVRRANAIRRLRGQEPNAKLRTLAPAPNFGSYAQAAVEQLRSGLDPVTEFQKAFRQDEAHPAQTLSTEPPKGPEVLSEPPKPGLPLGFDPEVGL